MIKLNFSRKWSTRHFSETGCYVVFLFLLLPWLYSAQFLETVFKPAYHLCLFGAGIFIFTFFEYVSHRFWMHDKEERHPGKSLERHLHHHRHPTVLKISAGTRNILLFADLLLISASFWLDNYFTLFTGFCSGFVFYCFIHVFLHQPWAMKVLPRLQAAHIHHHCKYPDRCFGISVTYWDKLFNTSVAKEVRIPDRILQFYFGHHHY